MSSFLNNRNYTPHLKKCISIKFAVTTILNVFEGSLTKAALLVIENAVKQFKKNTILYNSFVF